MNGTFVGALRTCARIKITNPNPEWVVETMPLARVMSDMTKGVATHGLSPPLDMTLLPNGEVLIINGGAAGTAGWEIGRKPILNPVLHRPENVIGSRFKVQNPSTVPRMYHSRALLLRDSRVLVGGSNPHKYYRFINVLYLTELSLEAFHPSYLDAKYTYLRPTIIGLGSQLSYTRVWRKDSN
ncbi:putative galactose oxidase/kelch, beta-propeller, galactose oxidase, beta-propeller [Rosa chinensis]|uniref:Putative galactose oxidase/kelch, beta-propeller, galactose oxidase, beta-propeller n=1 Tax=Rosa chinensis TaxID=74649 RepID=A0A2P6PZ02_ROSCH|nr:putative galactose oxidase/kelch, beta-propeller, galactose oxidase, beta-propeller [Rosa chinensis]